MLFFLLLYLSLMSLSSLPIWRDERLLFIRERAAGLYRTPAYFTAVVLFDLLPLRVIPPTFFALVTYPSVGLHPSCPSCILWFIVTLVCVNKCGGVVDEGLWEGGLGLGRTRRNGRAYFFPFKLFTLTAVHT